MKTGNHSTMPELAHSPTLNFQLAPHQIRCDELLGQGKSLILRSPTGSGKSEAIWLPFLKYGGEKLPNRMIHVLPSQALANQLRDRAAKLAEKFNPNLRVAAMHGRRPETVLFYADMIFATIDQVVTSYACTPLTLGVRHGNIPAGAVAGSFLVFDEVHTFEPARGLQSILVIAERAKKLGVPFVIMSATLPKVFLDELRERFELEVIEGDRLPNERPRLTELHVHEQRLDDQNLNRIAALLTDANKALIVANTVDRAIKLYDALKQRFAPQRRVLLAHSRFYDDDRVEKEQEITRLFGPGAEGKQAILVATQVVEVGLDISCDVLLTELAPVDALIQRAGRCVRWGGKGKVHVFIDLEGEAPYEKDAIDQTRRILKTICQNPRELNWQLEKMLVDEVLGEKLKKWADPDKSGEVLNRLAEAAFKVDRKRAHSSVRDSLDVEIAIHDKPEELKECVLRLPRCRLNSGLLENFLKEHKPIPRIWMVKIDDTDTGSRDDYETDIQVTKLNNPTVNGFRASLYIIDPEFARYDSEYGLRLGCRGEPATPLRSPTKQTQLPNQLKCETWEQHVDEIVRVFNEIVLPKERFAFRALAKYLNIEEDLLREITYLVLIFHDLGKLTAGWQRKIKQDLNDAELQGSFLAHRGGVVRGLPPHATVSAWVAHSCIEKCLPPKLRERKLVDSLRQAIAHHHSVRATTVPEFIMVDGWFEPVRRAVEKHTKFKVSEEYFDTKSPQGSGDLRSRPDFLSHRYYVTYVLLSRWLRLSDRIATAGGKEDAIYDYEKWFGGF